MKNFTFLITSIIISLTIFTAYPCDVNLSADKTSYKIGETAIITVKINRTHKNCEYEQTEHKIKQTESEITAKTKMKQTANGVQEIKYKIKITGKNASLNALQNCSKGGFADSINLNIED